MNSIHISNTWRRLNDIQFSQEPDRLEKIKAELRLLDSEIKAKLNEIATIEKEINAMSDIFNQFCDPNSVKEEIRTKVLALQALYVDKDDQHPFFEPKLG